MPKAAKAGLGRSHGDELVQRTLDGSVQRPSPEADRARPAATVPAQANRRKKRKATGSAGEPPAAAARSPTAASQGHSDRQPAATAAQDGSPGQLLIGNYHVGGPINLETPKQNVPPAVVNLLSPPSAARTQSPPSGDQAKPIDPETDQASQGTKCSRAIILD